MARLLTGLGVRHVGSVVAEALADRYPSLYALMDASAEELAECPASARDRHGRARIFRTRAESWLVEKLAKAGVRVEEAPKSEASDRPQPFEGLTFVITGTLPTMTRDDARDFILERGGKVTGSVSGSTDYLVVGENAGSKLTKAESLGVPTLDEEQLRALAG